MPAGGRVFDAAGGGILECGEVQCRRWMDRYGMSQWTEQRRMIQEETWLASVRVRVFLYK
jgi:hypothetical protein